MRGLIGLADLPTVAARADEPKAPQEVVDIVQLRCMMCHSAEPMEWIGEAPKGVLLDTPEHIARFAPAIAMQAVLTHAMPPNNFSQITDEERAVLARWLKLETWRRNDGAAFPTPNAPRARRLMARLDAFAAFTDEPGRLTRLFLSDAHKRAAAAFIGWCGEAGLAARIDAAGNVVARYEGREAGAPALMLGSHIDTVRDAGRYDGNYGALAALAVVEDLAAARRAARPRGRDRRLRRRGGRALPHHAHRLARARRRLIRRTRSTRRMRAAS